MLQSRHRRNLTACALTLSFLVGCSGNEVARLADPSPDLTTADADLATGVSLLSSFLGEPVGVGTSEDAQVATDVADALTAALQSESLSMLSLMGGGGNLVNSSFASRLARSVVAGRSAMIVPPEPERNGPEFQTIDGGIRVIEEGLDLTILGATLQRDGQERVTLIEATSPVVAFGTIPGNETAHPPGCSGCGSRESGGG